MSHDDEQLADVLSEFARTMLTDFRIESILDHLVTRIVGLLPITAAGVTLITPPLIPHFVAASAPLAMRLEQLQTDLGEGPCLLAYQSGSPVVEGDLALSTTFPLFAGPAVAAGVGAVFAFPLKHGQSPLGALGLYRDSPGLLSPKATRTARTLADVAAAYLLNAQTRLELQEAATWLTTSPCTTSSPAYRTGPCCWNDSTTPSCAVAAPAPSRRCSSSTSTDSKR